MEQRWVFIPVLTWRYNMRDTTVPLEQYISQQYVPEYSDNVIQTKVRFCPVPHRNASPTCSTTVRNTRSKSSELGDVDTTLQGPLFYTDLICHDRKWDQHQLLIGGPALQCMQRR
jgi:hypothetical protein